MNLNYHLLFKYIIVGDVSTGKSSILLRFIDNKFNENYQSTLGVQFGSKIITSGATIIKTMIWDTAGQQSFKSIIRSYYKNAIVALFVFDVTNLQSFENVHKWLQEVKDNANPSTKMILVGNKIDINDKRAVSKQMAEEFAKNNAMPYFQVSAKSGTNISEVFNITAGLVVNDIWTGKILIHNHNQTMGIKIGNPNLGNHDFRRLQDNSIQISGGKKEQQKCNC